MSITRDLTLIMQRLGKPLIEFDSDSKFENQFKLLNKNINNSISFNARY